MNKPKIYYDREVDALWILVNKGAEADSDEIAPGITVEYGKKGNVIGFEILNASSILRSIKERKSAFKRHLQIAS